VTLARDAPLLRAQDLSIGWSRGGNRATLASGICLDIRAGELAALIGPNGSGKSTLLRSLVGFQRPLSGEVELCGDPVASITVEERARRAACVFTGRFDSGWFTVFDIVAFGRYPFTDARNRLSARDRAAVSTAIESVGLGSFSARRFLELSDGERQKALIARAIAQDCPLLVLDEPTAFLDAGARIEVFHLALRLARDEGKAVVLSTHDLDLALRYADELWLLDRTHHFESGAPEALAMSGGIGRAFDGPALRFDPNSGTFRSADAIPRVYVSVEGEDPEAAWTEHLVARLGLGLVPPGSGGAAATGASTPDARIVIRHGSSSTAWLLIESRGERSFASIGTLADALRALEGARSMDSRII
jgi:iron complex transport system ATP-binding protein